MQIEDLTQRLNEILSTVDDNHEIQVLKNQVQKLNEERNAKDDQKNKELDGLNQKIASLEQELKKAQKLALDNSQFFHEQEQLNDRMDADFRLILGDKDKEMDQLKNEL